MLELVRDGNPVFVDFWRDGCQPCRTMDGIINELAEQFEGRAVVVKAKAEEVPEAFMKLNVRGTPTFMILTGVDQPGSKAIHQRYRATGLVKKDVLVRSLERALPAP